MYLGLSQTLSAKQKFEITAGTTGVINGYTNLPVINEGDAVIPDSEPSSAIKKHVTEHNNAEPMFDEDEII